MVETMDQFELSSHINQKQLNHSRRIIMMMMMMANHPFDSFIYSSIHTEFKVPIFHSTLHTSNILLPVVY